VTLNPPSRSASLTSRLRNAPYLLASCYTFCLNPRQSSRGLCRVQVVICPCLTGRDLTPLFISTLLISDSFLLILLLKILPTESSEAWRPLAVNRLQWLRSSHLQRTLQLPQHLVGLPSHKGPCSPGRLSHGVDEAVSYEVVYKEGGSGWKPEPEQATFTHAIQSSCCNPLFPPTPECSVSDTTSHLLTILSLQSFFDYPYTLTPLRYSMGQILRPPVRSSSAQWLRETCPCARFELRRL